MASKPSLVITSIAASDNPVLQAWADGCQEHGWDFWLIQDAKSPKGFHLAGCKYLGVQDQLILNFKLPKLLPLNHYARKNIGYLVAAANGAELIVETDDDNAPNSDFWNPRKVLQHCPLIENSGWTNIYKYFTHKAIWPRGLALEHIKDIPVSLPDNTKELNCFIQQGLVNGDPDVDALYRMTGELPIEFNSGLGVALGKGSLCPFNSQNTSWFREAFLLMYLPSYCTMRVSDIWRSFVAQRICQANNWPILFHQANAVQVRNEHDLMADFADELPGYLHNAKIVNALSNLKLQSGPDNMAQNLMDCYRLFMDMNLLPSKELELLEAWVEGMDLALSK